MASTGEPTPASRPTELSGPPPGGRGGRDSVPAPATARADLTEVERRLLDALFAIVSEHAPDSSVEIDRARVEDAFVFACEHHADQRRKSGEDFIVDRKSVV